MGITPNNTSGFGDVENAARVFARNELIPLQNRFEELNDWIGEEVVKFDPYMVDGLTQERGLPPFNGRYSCMALRFRVKSVEEGHLLRVHGGSNAMDEVQAVFWVCRCHDVRCCRLARR
jgi:hypothetical protein